MFVLFSARSDEEGLNIEEDFIGVYSTLEKAIFVAENETKNYVHHEIIEKYEKNGINVKNMVPFQSVVKNKENDKKYYIGKRFYTQEVLFPLIKGEIIIEEITIDNKTIVDENIIFENDVVKKKVKYQLCDDYEEKIENIYFNEYNLKKINKCSTLKKQDEYLKDSSITYKYPNNFEIKLVKNDNPLEVIEGEKSPNRYEKV